MTDLDRGPVRTLRATSSLVSFWAAVAVVVFLFGDAVLRGAWEVVGRWLPLALLILWLLWVVLWRSSVRFDRRELVVVNPFRVHTIPWSQVAEVLRGPQLRVELRDGRRVSCFGGPFPGRPGRATDAAADAVLLLEAARESAAPDPAPVRIEWDLVPLLVGAALAVATGLSLFVRFTG